LRYISYLSPINVSDLSFALRLDRTTLVRNLKPLEERKLVEDISGTGTRNRELQLTESGRQVFESANNLWEKAQSDLATYLGSEDAGKLSEILEKIEHYKQV
jgi:DNA-binding MarR family transcriptional regulator